MIEGVIRASQVYKICTSRIVFDEENFFLTKEALFKKAQEKKEFFDGSVEDAIRLAEKNGLMLVARAFLKEVAKQEQAILDPLPAGAKTELQKIWLENNFDLYSFNLKENSFPLRKGILCESDAIQLISTLYTLPFEKCKEDRKVKGFLSGECDIKYGTSIRDTKCPETWESFRNKSGIETPYYWQLIAYCYLYDCSSAFLDYVLMNTPEELIADYVKNFSEEEYQKFLLTEKTISKLPLEHRVKTYNLECDLESEIEFMLSRLKKAQEYYETLDFETCMNLLQTENLEEVADISWN